MERLRVCNALRVRASEPRADHCLRVAPVANEAVSNPKNLQRGDFDAQGCYGSRVRVRRAETQP